MLSPLKFLLFLVLWCAPAFAEVDLAWVHDLNKRVEAYQEKVLSQEDKCPLIEEVRHRTETVRQSFIESHFKAPSSSEKPSFLICVSFSMPLATLKALARQAKQYGGVLTLRGLVKGSFPETVKALRKLEEEIQIDPTVFESFNVSSVPTFIIRQDKTHDTLSGNVSVEHALKEFAQKGDLKERVQDLLQKGGGA